MLRQIKAYESVKVASLGDNCCMYDVAWRAVAADSDIIRVPSDAFVCISRGKAYTLYEKSSKIRLKHFMRDCCAGLC